MAADDDHTLGIVHTSILADNDPTPDDVLTRIISDDYHTLETVLTLIPADNDHTLDAQDGPDYGAIELAEAVEGSVGHDI
jgi:hypothetical protein